ncbi:MAG TPA: nucleoside hydrolase [Methylomirabilota bacterium]|nr:nucleoside hydrolase [Methylomirabilota bacterium]
MERGSPAPVLIDTDPGIDDALALLLAWGSPEVRVEAVTTVAGNVRVEDATLNVYRLIELRAPNPAPRVGRGAGGPLARRLRMATRYHGRDGLGDVPSWELSDVRSVFDAGPEPGVPLLVETARRFGAALTLVALGPLTNVAIAVTSDRQAMGRVGRVVAMGGAVDVPGNVTAEAEFNVHVDPEAAGVVLDAGLSLDLVPLDATRQATLMRRELEAALARCPGPVATRVAEFTRRAFRRHAGAMHLHDPLAVAVVVDPALVEWEAVRLEVDAGGATRRVPGAPNCRIATRVDRARLLATLLPRLCAGQAR